MRPSFFVGVLAGDDGHAATRRDEAFRAWHRQPDAEPLPNDPRERLSIVQWLVRAVALLVTFGRHA